MAQDDLTKILGVSKSDVDRGMNLHQESIVCDAQFNEPAVFSEPLIAKTKELLDRKLRGWAVFSQIDNFRVAEIAKGGKARDLYTEAWKLSGVTAGSTTLGYDMAAIGHAVHKNDILSDLGIGLKATRADHILAAKKTGRHAIIWNFQDSIALEPPRVWVEDNLALLEAYYNVGIRMIQLTYNLRNLSGDGCTERYQSGLSQFGVKVVEKMNELGMIVDTGHCGVQTTLDAVEVSKTPVAASHTSCRSVYDHPRGKSDEELQAIAEKGGFIGVYTHPAFITKGGRGTVKDFLDHVDYLVKLVGVDHVGIGTDCWDISNISDMLVDAMDKEVGRFWTGFTKEHEISRWVHPPKTGPLAWSNWPSLTIGLISRGYSDQEIKKIIGENFLNIFREICG
jgi:membrane dipeptidase